MFWCKALNDIYITLIWCSLCRFFYKQLKILSLLVHCSKLLHSVLLDSELYAIAFAFAIQIAWSSTKFEVTKYSISINIVCRALHSTRQSAALSDLQVGDASSDFQTIYALPPKHGMFNFILLDLVTNSLGFTHGARVTMLI